MGLAIPGGFHDNQLYRLPDHFLQFSAEAIEFPREEIYGNVTFVGPVISKVTEHADNSIESWLETRDRNTPLVFVTQGTIANRDLEQLLRPAIDGLAMENVDVLVTTGRDVSTEDLTAASNTRLESYVPYEVVLPQAAVFVTNGGYVGVQHALSCGVPVIVAGLTQDKPRVGHRVEWSGVGIDLKTATPTKEQVRNAVNEILTNSSYRQRALHVQTQLSQVDTIETIENIVNSAIHSVAPMP